MSREDSNRASGILKKARCRRKRVDPLAEGIRRRALRALGAATRRWAVSKLIVQQSFAHLGLLLYGVLALVGMLYAAMFYWRFGIPVLDFYETPDFLLGATASPVVLGVGVLAVGVVVGLLILTYSKYAQGDAHGQADDSARSRLGRRWALGLALVAFVSPFVVATVAGLVVAEVIASKKNAPIRVTLRGDLPTPNDLPEPGTTILLGATNRFHFFFECSSDVNQGDCQKGRPFVVPTDNVAAVAYGEAEKETRPPSAVAEAIDKLTKAVGGLGKDIEVHIEQVDASFDTDDLEAAIGGLTSAVAPLDVVAKVEPPELTLKPVLDPDQLTVKAEMETSELTVKAVLEPAELTVKAELDAEAIPVHSHQASTVVVVPDGDGSVAPVYAVPFVALSPLTTNANGIAISDRRREWLGEFYRSLSACGDVRVTVTGHASRQGFGDPRHASVWSKVLHGVPNGHERMNCGLANLRGLNVVAALFSSTETDDVREGLTAVVEAETRLGEKCLDGDEDCQEAKAGRVRNLLLRLCPLEDEMRLEWSGIDDGHHTRVRLWSWRTWQDRWDWLGDDQSDVLDRSVHIVLDPKDGGAPACPQFQDGSWAARESTRLVQTGQR